MEAKTCPTKELSKNKKNEKKINEKKKKKKLYLSKYN